MPKKSVRKNVKKAAGDIAERITKNNPAREDRIEDYLVDTYNDPQDKAMGWYYSLEDAMGGETVHCRCTKKRSMSPLEKRDEVDIVCMAPDEDCTREMFVFVQWNDRQIAVPLSQLEPLDGSDEAIQVIEDWLYWCLMGYEF